MKTLLFIEKSMSGIIGMKKAKKHGLNVVLMSSNRYKNRVRPEEEEYIDELIEVDTNSIDLVVQESLKLNERVKIDGVMSFFEFTILQTAHVARMLNLPALSVESAHKARNKFLMREAFAKSGVPIPAYRECAGLEDAMRVADEMGYPNVIKSVNLAGSHTVYKNNSRTDLKNNYEYIQNYHIPFGMKKIDTLLIEEYMNGQEFSVETAYQNGRHNIVAFTRKEVEGDNSFVEIGHVIPGLEDQRLEEEIHDVVVKGIDALGIDCGVTHTEIKVTEDGPKLVEINARLGGDHIPELVEMATGVDLWDIALSIALSEKADLTLKKECGAAIHYVTADPGTVVAIDGIEEARNVNGVGEVHMNVKRGDTIQPLKSSLDRLGYVIATGRNAKEAEANVKKAIGLIKIATS